jgi:hypothetical protein
MVTVLGAAVLLALPGCTSDGGDGVASAGGEATGTAGAEVEEAGDEERAFQFVDCMRDNGIDLPDPEPDGKGGFDFGLVDAGVDLDDPAFQEALGACRDKLPGGGDRNLDDPEVQEALREFAKCMRDNGIDLPDPDPDGGFGGGLADIDRTSPAFQEAFDACRGKLPKGGL